MWPNLEAVCARHSPTRQKMKKFLKKENDAKKKCRYRRTENIEMHERPYGSILSSEGGELGRQPFNLGRGAHDTSAKINLWYRRLHGRASAYTTGVLIGSLLGLDVRRGRRSLRRIVLPCKDLRPSLAPGASASDFKPPQNLVDKNETIDSSSAHCFHVQIMCSLR